MSESMDSESGLSAHERATKKIEEKGLPEDNPFTEIIRGLHEDGESWQEIYATMEEVFDVVDEGAYEESFQIMPDWKVAAVEHDPNATSGERYEYYERTAETAKEAEEMVERYTGYRIASEKTEQVGTSKVA